MSSTSEEKMNVFAEVIEVVDSFNEFEYLFFLPIHQVEIDILRDKRERAVEILEAIPIEKRQSKDDEAMYCYLKGKILEISPDYNELAEDHLTEAIKLNPNMADAWIYLGTCIWKRGDLDKAKSCFKSCYELDQKNKQALLHLSVIERRQCQGLIEIENPEEIIRESVRHAMEAVALDIQDGISWYVLGNACLTSYFATGCWDVSMLLQSLQAYKNAKKDERMLSSIHLCFNCSLTYKFLEDYETAIAGFEAASSMEPGLTYANAQEEASYLYEILDGIVSFLQDLNDDAKLLPSPTSSLPTADSLASLLSSAVLNPTYEKATVESLNEGPNQGKAVTGKVLFSVKNPDFHFTPIYYVVLDSDGTCFVITVYGVHSSAIKEEDQVILLDPFYHIFDIESKGKRYQFKSLRMDFWDQVRVNGAVMSREHEIHKTMYPLLQEA
ncbi:hypothetical protein RND71_007000 [Anisodus tanguticus]|uniref:Tetratricopeptide repeat protein 5 OB fold domain-containing protein n=1 Tax=Anisodus tanguticus TaxID=243964 RepID=A0AAE1SV89_9SOLA|nr:hypothetical protein RND71_007000 [Anisodus tanguticus]